MARSKQDQALCALVETLFAAKMSPEEQWPEVFEALRKILHFSSAVFMPIDPVNWTLQPGYTYDCSNLTAEYLAHYQRLDPYVTAAACLKSCNTPVRFSDVADIARVSQGEFGSFLRQVPYFHALVSAPLLCKAVRSGWWASNGAANSLTSMTRKSNCSGGLDCN